MLARYRGKTVCPVCKGSRLKSEALYVKIGNKSIGDLVMLPITELISFFNALELDETDSAIAARLLTEIRSRLRFLVDVGLGYLTLNRLSNTLSGGESQRVKLATELSRVDTGNTLYVLDEPTTGLHFEDIRVLLSVLNKLVDKGNTVIVIEHNLDIIKCADYIIDLGPEGGEKGGYILATGKPQN